MNRVFVSYSRRNKNFAERLARDLSDAGLDVWVDFRQIHGGELWRKEIDKGIARSEMLVVVLSPAAVASTWVPYEVNSAREQGKFIIPVMAINALPQLELSENMKWLLDVHFINFIERYEEAFPELLNALPGKRRFNPFDEVDPATIPNPFKGLEAFQQTDSHFFFGREELIKKSLKRLATESNARFLAVVGASGSGKSSLVRAGLIPEIRGGALNGSDHWPVFIFTPGNTPVQSLAERLAPLVQSMDVDAVRTDLYTSDDRLHHIVSAILARDDEASRLLMVVDQFEEVFTRAGEVERQAFLKMLYHAVTVEDGQAQVMITMRADFFDHLGRYPPLAELFEQENMVIVTEMSAANLLRSIEGPAEAVGLVYEEGLPQRILDDVRRQPGSLPLLQYALKELYEAREGRRLTMASYEKIGGVSKALAQHAEDIYVELNAAQQAIMRRVMLRLIEVSESGEATRRQVDLNELHFRDVPDSEIESIIDLMTAPESRLLTTSREIRFAEDTQVAPTTWVEVAHEALIRQWDRFTGWVRENVESLRFGTELLQAASDWRHSGGDAAYLLRGNRLTRAEIWLEGNDATQLQQDFIQASIDADRERKREEAAQAERELLLQQRATNRLRYFVGVLVLGLAVAGGLTLFAVNQANEAERASREADRQADVALSLARSASANQALIDNENDLAVLLALAANEIEDAPLQSQRDLASIAFGPGTRDIFDAHEDQVLDVAFAPGGEQAVSVEDDTLYLWQVDDGAILWQVTLQDGLEAFSNALAFDPMGAFVVTRGDTSTIQMWSAETGDPLPVFDGVAGHDAALTTLDVSPDGSQIVSGGADWTVILWDTISSTARRFDGGDLGGHTAAVRSVAFSDDGRWVVSGGDDNTIIIWDATTGLPVQRVTADNVEPAVVNDLTFDPSGELIMAALSNPDMDGSQVVVLERESGTVTFRANYAETVTTVTFSPEFDPTLDATNHLIMFGLQSGSLVLYDLLQATVVNQFDVHTGSIRDVTFNEDGRSLLSASADGTVRVWDIVRAAQVQQFTGHATGPRQSTVTGVLTENGYRVLSGSYDGTLRLWDTTTGRVLQEFTEHEGRVNDVAISPDGRMALSGDSEDAVILWNLETGESVVLEGHDTDVNTVAFFADGQRALSGDADGNIILWNLDTGTAEATFAASAPGDKSASGHTAAVLDLAISPDGRMFASASFDRTLIVWDVTTGEVLRTLDGHKSSVRSVDFSPDGQQIASGAANGSLILWDADDGLVIRRIDEHEGAITGVEFTNDGQQVFTGSLDYTMRLWDLDRGLELRIHETTEMINSIDLSEDERVVLAGLNNGTLSTWLVLVDPDELVTWTRANRFVVEPDCVQRELFQLTPLCVGGVPPEITPEALPTETPIPTDYPQLVAGNRAEINTTDGDLLNVRSAASIGAEIVTQLEDGAIVTLLEGRTFENGYWWWPVRIADGTEGWVVEAIPEESLQTLVPYTSGTPAAAQQ